VKILYKVQLTFRKYFEEERYAFYSDKYITFLQQLIIYFLQCLTKSNTKLA